ncbi:hypothetical protein [Veillonella rogosae]|uniref:hypothetical protein n=1 Tax=Veillonella rogosae TaxID=423477 RepID=UPI0006D23ED8|nr:hypothetical protein [Veillonella rogosae]
METKWYSDFKELCISPFKTGIPPNCNVWILYERLLRGGCSSQCCSSLLTTFIPALIISMMQLHHTFYGRIFVMSANGGVAMQLAFNLFLTFLGLSLNAYLVSWVANKFDAQTTPQEVLKVNWYSYAYGQLLALIGGLLIMPASIYFFINIDNFGPLQDPLDLPLSIILYVLISFFILMGGISLWTWWVSLNLLSQQINKPKLSTFGISLLAGLIPFVIISAIMAFIVFTVMNMRYSSGLF